MYHFGASTKHTGVAIAVHQKLNDYVTTYRTITDRIGTVTMKTGSETMHIVVAYAPTLKNSEDKKKTVRKDFYNKLHSAVDGIPSSHQLYILGDFNAKTGRTVIKDGHVETEMCENMGRHGKGRRNSNGTALLSFAEERDLFLCNTAFEHKAGSTATWRSMARQKRKDGKGTYVVFNQIDYILCTRRQR
jgi:exonuclease III